MIVGIFIITGVYGKFCSNGNATTYSNGGVGPAFWDQPVLTFFGLDNVPLVVKYIPNRGLNDAFMVFGAVGLAINIVTR
jgi:ethanolaminephosphotransferase